MSDGIERIGELIRKIKKGEETVFDFKPGKDGVNKLVVERRELNPEAPREPSRKETDARQHMFYAVSGLMNYISKYGGNDTVIYADHGASRISAVINEKAKDGTEIVVMEPLPHPRWKPWADQINLGPVPLDVFVEFIRNNRRSITDPEGRGLVLLMSQIKMSTSIEMNRGRGSSAVNGLVIQTEISGNTERDVVSLPESLTISTPVYVDTETRKIEVDLVIEGDKTGTLITASLAAADIKEAQIEAFDAICSTILGNKNFKGTFTYGRPEYRPWNYLK